VTLWVSMREWSRGRWVLALFRLDSRLDSTFGVVTRLVEATGRRKSLASQHSLDFSGRLPGCSRRNCCDAHRLAWQSCPSEPSSPSEARRPRCAGAATHFRSLQSLVGGRTPPPASPPARTAPLPADHSCLTNALRSPAWVRPESCSCSCSCSFLGICSPRAKREHPPWLALDPLVDTDVALSPARSRPA
jgi:hypothetical protein